MIDGTYKIGVDVPFGRKDGMLVLRTEGDVLYAEIDAPIVGKQSMVGRAEGDSFTVEGSGKFKLVGKVDYTLTGVVNGDNLSIEIKSTKGELKLEGVRV